MCGLSRRSQQGFSLMELMIGLAVGLIVLAGASTLMVSQVTDHRRLTLETRTQQDVRALGELIARELQLAGSWGAVEKGIWSETNPAPLQNPYGAIDVAEDGRSVVFYRSDAFPGSGIAEDNAVSPAETRGLRWDGRAIQFRIGEGGWQALTDTGSLNVTAFSVSMSTASIEMPSVCSKPCDGLANCPPRREVRNLRVTMAAEPTNDPRVKRDLDLTVKNQSAEVVGVCRS